MPIFEYRCRDCGAKFEKILNSAKEKVTCKDCDSTHVDKLLSVFAVSGTARQNSPIETSQCGSCGAPRRGMCGE